MQYLLSVLTSRNAKKTQTDQSIPKRLKLIIGKTCFDECFLFRVVTGRHYFSQKFIVSLR